MLTGTILVVLIGAVVVLCFRRSREWLTEEAKAFSDVLVVGFLRLTSQFGSELTKDGLAEQRMWREQRLRNLRGLALRSKEAFSGQRSAFSKKTEQKNI
jgi:hypothetical protein